MQSKVWLILLPCNHFPFFSATGAHNGRQSLDLHIPIFAAEGAAAFHLQSILLKSIEAALRSAHPSDQILTQRFRGCTSRQPLCYHLDRGVFPVRLHRGYDLGRPVCIPKECTSTMKSMCPVYIYFSAHSRVERLRAGATHFNTDRTRQSRKPLLLRVLFYRHITGI